MPAHGNTDPVPEDARLRLADLVKTRRQELGLSVRAAADSSGLARGTWIALEDGSRRTADSNYAGIERALEWATGSVAATLEGGSPTTAHLGSAVVANAGTATGRASASPAEVSTGRDDALTRVMRSPDLTEGQKRRIVELLIAERAAFDRQIAERAEQMIELARGES